MRNLVLTALAIVALCACGASSKEVAMAKTARYQGDKLQLFAEAKAAFGAKYDVVKTDEVSLGMQSKPRWYTPEGLAANDAGDVSMMQDRSLKIAMTVQLLPDGDAWIVKVTPTIARYNKGSPQLEPVTEGDISLPNWVQAKTDTLALDVHNQLAKYEVKTVPAAVTGPAAPEQPGAPAADGSAAPAAGSAQ